MMGVCLCVCVSEKSASNKWNFSFLNFAKFEMDRNADAFVYHNIYFFVSKQNSILQIVHTSFPL